MNCAQEWFHFYANFKPKGKLCSRRSISFFNELEIEWEFAHRHLFHFLMSSTQNGNFAQEWFHFYASLKPKGKLCLRTSISCFNELDLEWELCS